MTGHELIAALQAMGDEALNNRVVFFDQKWEELLIVHSPSLDAAELDGGRLLPEESGSIAVIWI